MNICGRDQQTAQLTGPAVVPIAQNPTPVLAALADGLRVSAWVRSPPRRGPSASRSAAIIAVLLTLLVILVGWSATVGQVYIPPLFGSVMHHFGLDIVPMPSSPNGEETLWTVRFPADRVGLIVGATLVCVGCLLQGVLANPLAEPGVIGVSAGAALGAGITIVSGGIWANVWGRRLRNPSAP